MTPLKPPEGSSLHHALSTVLRSAITSGRYAPGDTLPGEHALVSAYGVSRATVRRALLTLEQGGLIERRAGRGTLVLDWAAVYASTSMERHKEALEHGAHRTTVRVLGIEEIPAPSDAAAALGIQGRAHVVAITRVRFKAKSPLRYMITYVERDLGRQLSHHVLELSTVVDALGRLGHQVRRADDEVGAILADATLAEALGRAVGDPLLDIARTMFDTSGRAVAYQRTFASPDVYKLRVIMSSEDEHLSSLAEVAAVEPQSP